LYRLVRRFDFDERPLGNFDDTPMRWRKLRGAGLPFYCAGAFDETLGHDAGPSFRLDIETGNVGYEYQALDVAVVPHADYRVRAFIKAQGLRYARALVAVYFVDRFGEAVPGSQRVSALVGDTGAPPDDWREVEIVVPGDYPNAFALRLQLWILQSHVWSSAAETGIDPIWRQDVRATAWFDDLAVYRLPKTRLRFSSPGCVARTDEAAFLRIDVNNATRSPLTAELRIVNLQGGEEYARDIEIEVAPQRGWFMAPSAGAARDAPYDLVEEPLPPLDPGVYEARLRLVVDGAALIERRLRFALLADLPGAEAGNADLGVSLERYPVGDLDGVTAALKALGAGAVKVGVPMSGAIDGESQRASLDELAQLFRGLGRERIDPVAIILTESAAAVAPTQASEPAVQPTLALLDEDGLLRRQAGPVLTHFGPQVSKWQLGTERVELASAREWTPGAVGAFRAFLAGFLSAPQLVVPQALSAAGPLGADATSILLSSRLPTRAVPRALEERAARQRPDWWVQVAAPEADERLRLAELARRVILAKAAGPERLFTPAPLEWSDRGGDACWQPGEDFVVLRTLFHCLSGRKAVATMAPAPDTFAILFEGRGSSVVLIWTWRDQPADTPIELYLGPQPQALDLLGRRIPIEVVEGRARLWPGPTPILIDSLYAPLAGLQLSYRLEPTFLEAHTQEAQPQVSFRNPYDEELVGELRVIPPPYWEVEPAEMLVRLAPGEKLHAPLQLTPPPRQAASDAVLTLELNLHQPEPQVLVFRDTLTVGLRGVDVEARARWEGDDLIVEHALANRTEAPFSFTGVCDAPGRARVETVFLNLSPGAMETRAYVFRAARDLAGAALRVGVREIRGQRGLDQLVIAPP